MAYIGLFFFSLLLLFSLISQLALPSQRARNIALLVSSLLFYFFGGVIYILVLLLFVLMFWYCAMLLPEAKTQRMKRVLVAVPVTFSLVSLFIFKYLTPLLETTRQMLLTPQVVPQIVIPLGISVYTLNLISYLVDVYREKLEPESNFLTLLTYASLFHLIPCGPIVPYRDIRQRLHARKPHPQNFSVGIGSFSLGVTKVVLLAAALESLCTQLLDRSNQGLLEAPALGLWLGVILSGIRLYLLLSGYSDIACGLGLMSGLRYPENFAYPLLSCSVSGFYEKWFLSLSGFLREYVTAPIEKLNANYKTFAAVVGYVLFALWFGGTPNFLLMGIFLAVVIPLEAYLTKKAPAAVRRALGILGIFLFFFLFSFTSLPRLWIALKGLFCLNPGRLFRGAYLAPALHALPLILVSICFCLPVGQILHNFFHQRVQEKPKLSSLAAFWEGLYPIALLILTGVLLLMGRNTSFLIV